LTQQIIETEISVIAYDDAKVSQIKAPMFDTVYWRDRATSSGQQGGRGAVLFVNHEGHDWAIRHYYRGGRIGKILTDQFFWSGQDDTRSFREWQLLRAIEREGLPAPVPVAARYQRHGFFYTADLIMEKIPDIENLATRYLENRLSSGDWRNVGACIAAFHEKGFCHPDLNASNLQLGSDGRVWLLDWDRGRRLHPGKWQQANLDRLQRSVAKFSAQDGRQPDAAGWQALLDGYAAAQSA